MKRTLLISVAALALAAGSNVALSQGGAGGAPSAPKANPSAPSGGQDTTAPGTKGQKGAQERAIPEKQQKSTQAPGGQGATTKQSQDDKSGQAPTTRQSRDEKSEQAPTTRQSRDEKSGQPSTQQQTQGQQPTQQRQQQQTQSPGGAKQGTAERSTTSTSSSTSSSVSLTTEQKTRIRQTVLTGSAPRVTSVNFDIRVGTVVPRTIRVAPLSPILVEIEPQWRGSMYFVYNDEIIIVEPGSLRIVAVLAV